MELMNSIQWTWWLASMTMSKAKCESEASRNGGVMVELKLKVQRILYNNCFYIMQNYLKTIPGF